MESYKKLLAARLLQHAAEILSEKVCNDFNLVSEGEVPPELVETINREFNAWNSETEQLTDDEAANQYAQDYALMDWLASILEQEANVQ